MANRAKWIGGTLLLWIAGVLFAAAYWASAAFGKINFATILYHLREPLQGTNMEPFLKAVPQVLIVSLLFAAAGLYFALRCDKDWLIALQIGRRRLTLPLDFWNRRYVLFAFLTLLFSVVMGVIYLGIPQYVWAQAHSSTFYEEYYADPAKTTITFPEKRQNLIYIFMESMENTYMSAEDGGLEYAEMIPQMRRLQLENTNFTADQSVNGAVTPFGTTWTMGGMAAQTAGIPLNLPIDGNAMDEENQFLKGAYSIGEILEKAGYRQEFLVGSDADFGGREYYLTAHGNYTIRDYDYARKNGWIPRDYYVWWGFEDKKLYEFAKTELQKLYETNDPFNLTMLTVDTHFINGYYCDLCRDEFKDDVYADAIACASRQVTDFVEWVQRQPFADDTTIVICGDHLTLDGDYILRTLGEYPAEGVRRVYTAIINPVPEYELDFNRSFTTFDMYPTTLASLGCTIEGNRLALGTNLYSEEPTLLEKLGVEELNRELELNSKYYNEHILYGENTASE